MLGIPRIKENLLAQIERQSRIPLSTKQKETIPIIIRLYNSGKFVEAQNKMNSLNNIESSTLGEIRHKLLLQLKKMALEI